MGDGVASPSLLGDKLYVFALDGGNEVLRCLDAASGKELWQDKYATQGASGAAGRFAGSRSSPTVADGNAGRLPCGLSRPSIDDFGVLWCSRPGCVGRRDACTTSNCWTPAQPTAIFSSAKTPWSHFSERSIIGPPWPSHSMLSTPS